MVCPRGGPHEWEYYHRGNVTAGAVTGTAGVCSLIFCWPALFCLPLIYVGTAKGVKVTSDRKCLRCGMVITHEGRMKSPPTGAATQRRPPRFLRCALTPPLRSHPAHQPRHRRAQLHLRCVARGRQLCH